MSILDTDELEEISDIKIAISNTKPTVLNIPTYSSLPEINDNMYNGQIILCNGDIFILSNKFWKKIICKYITI